MFIVILIFIGIIVIILDFVWTLYKPKKKKTFTSIKPTESLRFLPYQNTGLEPTNSNYYSRRMIGSVDPASGEVDTMQPILDSSGRMVGLTGHSDTARRISTEHILNHLRQEIERLVSLSGETNQPIITGVQGGFQNNEQLNMDFASLYQHNVPILNIIPERIRETPLALSEGRLNYFRKIYSRENVGIQCKTHSIAKQILFIANHLGYGWTSHDEPQYSYIDDDAWDDFKQETCYDINEGTYGSVDDFNRENYEILDGGVLLNIKFNDNGKRQINLKKILIKE